jgi:hypothetical protein
VNAPQQLQFYLKSESLEELLQQGLEREKEARTTPTRSVTPVRFADVSGSLSPTISTSTRTPSPNTSDTKIVQNPMHITQAITSPTQQEFMFVQERNDSFVLIDETNVFATTRKKRNTKSPDSARQQFTFSQFTGQDKK